MPDLTDQERARREKLHTLISAGHPAFPARLSRPRKRIIEILDAFDSLVTAGRPVAAAGRIRAIRVHGKSAFLDIDDGTAKIQCHLTADGLGKTFDSFSAAIDLGDFIEVAGPAFTTKRGERSLKAERAVLLAKALRPLPSGWHGLEDVEVRYRHRELDLIANDESRRILTARSEILRTIRTFLEKEKFLEVETPILQAIPGGATARPFVTHHNALNSDFYLRVAPELYLKRLIIGGLERVFEIARCFRNEGIDHAHNPEFTQVEVYAAYTDYEWMMKFTERMLRTVTKAVLGATEFSYQGQVVKLLDHFPRLTFRDAILAHGGPDLDQISDDRELAAIAKRAGVDISDKDHRGSIMDGLFKTLVRPKIIQPTFIIDHPIELSPLAKKRRDDPRYVERFQLLIAQSELCNAFSELNDPIDQRQRFESQEQLRAQGDDEAQRIDEDFLEAMEYGMPPTSGLGLGIDRLAMLLTGQTAIKEVIAFPTLKPKS